MAFEQPSAEDNRILSSEVNMELFEASLHKEDEATETESNSTTSTTSTNTAPTNSSNEEDSFEKKPQIIHRNPSSNVFQPV